MSWAFGQFTSRFQPWNQVVRVIAESERFRHNNALIFHPLLNGQVQIVVTSERITQEYREQTKRPAMAIAVMIPMLLIYELGGFVTSPVSSRSGLEQLIFSLIGHQVPVLVIPILSVLVVLGWHKYRGDHWSIEPWSMIGIFLEAGLLGAILFSASQAVIAVCHPPALAEASFSLLDHRSNSQIISQTSRYCGTSVFEEILFRMMLLSGGIFLCSRLMLRPVAVVIPLIVTSFLFAAMHYSLLNPSGSPFDVTSFMWRSLLGAVFSVIFLYRGLAIVIVTHAAYNVLSMLFARS